MDISQGYRSGAVIFKDYRNRGLLGKGGYGTVYRVQNAAGVSFALKVLQDGLEMEQQGFEAVIRCKKLEGGAAVGGQRDDER